MSRASFRSWSAPVFLGAMALVVWNAVFREPQPSATAQAPAASKPTVSNVHGSPEPPPLLKAERAFPKITVKNPVLIARVPACEKVFGHKRLFAADQNGKFVSFKADDAASQVDLFLDLAKAPLRPDMVAGPARFEASYGLVFPPDFETNRVCYVCYVLAGKPTGQIPDGSRVSRFKVEGNPPRAVPESEEVIITWLGGGHNGGDLHFGPDGCLYISTGDGSFPNPPDALVAGQDMTNLLCSILRIDVRKPQGERRYTIPADNPFVDLPGARGEIWAYGFRNPWRMSFDSVTGDLWVGDVGWESYETVNRIEKGGNYGWSIMEGPQPVRTEAKPGPTPILAPAIAIPHSEGMSVTGGYVYRGRQFPELTGQYIFGDWETRRMWAAKWDGKQVTSRVDIAEPTVRVSAFGLDYDDELLMFDYDNGTLHRFVRNPEYGTQTKFPQTLSETGLFTSVKDHTVAAGVVPYEINVEQWADHAVAERFVYVAGGQPILWHEQPRQLEGSMFSRTLEFPPDSVLIKTLSLDMEAGKPETRRRIETQLLHFTPRGWRAYSYAWNDAQTDATLVASDGDERTLTVRDPGWPGGNRVQNWMFAGRATCMRCHNNWTQNTLAFNVPQLNRESKSSVNQLTRLMDLHVLKYDPLNERLKGTPPELADLPKFTPPFETAADLDARARSYLHVNCGHCHRYGGSGTADIDLTIEPAIEKTKALGARPLQGTFGIHEAKIIAPADPYRSILFYRMSKIGRGRMPYVGSEIPDPRGVELIHDWIRQLPVHTDERAKIRRLKEIDEATALAAEQKNLETEIDGLALNVAREDMREKPTDADRKTARERQKGLAAGRVEARRKERVETIASLLSSPMSALLLSRAVAAGELPRGVTAEVLAAGTTHTDMAMRDLFEPFLPSEKRSKRLGTVVRPAQILKMTGDIQKGRELFLSTTALACKNCHKVAETGSTLGPDLTQVGKRLNKSQILESILEPSKFIDPKYITQQVETHQGKVFTGLLVSRTGKEVVLRNAEDKEVRIPAEDIEQMLPQRLSLMPDLQVRDLTAQQLADLLAFLESLK